MNLPTLYKKTKTGAVQEWTVDALNGVSTTYGQVGGKLQIESYLPEAKNVGRSNETSAAEQAEIEAFAKWKKQLKKGYLEDPAGVSGLTLPPLAKKYQDFSSNIKWPCYVSTKYDGLRCTVFFRDGEVFFQTRGGEEYPDLEHISDSLYSCIFKFTPDVVLDGELYCHGMHLEDIVRACKSKTHYDLRARIKFYVFDYLNSVEDTALLEDRVGRLSEFVTTSYHTVVGVEQVLLENEKEMIDMHNDCVAGGYEGVVLRNTDSVFTFGERTSDFQKYKVPEDAEYLVVGMEKTKQGGGVCVCEYFYDEDYTKGTFKVNIKCTKEKKVDLWENQSEYIGKWLKVRFEKLSKYGKPTKPIGICFREVKDGKVME